MKCETAQQVFSEYVEETIEKPLALTFEHHLKQCEECRRAYGSFRSTWRILESFPIVEAPSGFRESVVARVKAQQETAAEKPSPWRFSLGNVLGVRVPARAFAWASAMLIFAVLLVQISPGVFRSTLTGPFGGPWVLPAGPGLDVSVRVSDAGTDADVYQIVLRPAPGAAQINARLCWLRNGKQFCRTEVYGGKEMVAPIVVKQPQGVTDPLGVAVHWAYGGRDFSKIIYLPRSQTSRQPSEMRLWSGDIQSALQMIAEDYGVVVSGDAGLSGPVELSGKIDNAKAALGRVAAQSGQLVRKEGSRVYRLEPKMESR
jgi:anti-sigma factor RsiW